MKDLHDFEGEDEKNQHDYEKYSHQHDVGHGGTSPGRIRELYSQEIGEASRILSHGAHQDRRPEYGVI